MSETRFLLVAYKPKSDDPSYRSDHVVENMLTADQLVREWAVYLRANMNLDRKEAGYEFWIFKNGIMVFREYFSDWDGVEMYGYNTDEYYAHHHEFEIQKQTDLTEINLIYTKAKQEAQQQQERQKEQKRKELQAEARKKKLADKEVRKQQFEKLRKEFGQ